jgi:hypothetical protein
MRYVKQISTGKYISSCSGGDPANPTHLQSMIDDAVNMGINPSDIEAGYMEDIDYAEVMEKQRIADMTYSDKRKSEYPTIEECVHAILDGELDDLQIKRQAVKEKYPKGDN